MLLKTCFGFVAFLACNSADLSEKISFETTLLYFLFFRFWLGLSLFIVFFDDLCRRDYEGTATGWRGAGVVAQPSDRRLRSHDRRDGSRDLGEGRLRSCNVDNPRGPPAT